MGGFVRSPSVSLTSCTNGRKWSKGSWRGRAPTGPPWDTSPSGPLSPPWPSGRQEGKTEITTGDETGSGGEAGLKEMHRSSPDPSAGRTQTGGSNGLVTCSSKLLLADIHLAPTSANILSPSSWRPRDPYSVLQCLVAALVLLGSVSLREMSFTSLFLWVVWRKRRTAL